MIFANTVQNNSNYEKSKTGLGHYCDTLFKAI